MRCIEEWKKEQAKKKAIYKLEELPPPREQKAKIPFTEEEKNIGSTLWTGFITLLFVPAVIVLTLELIIGIARLVKISI